MFEIYRDRAHPYRKGVDWLCLTDILHDGLPIDQRNVYIGDGSDGASGDGGDGVCLY